MAILLVVLGHAGFLFFPGGFVGVDVFFVLSGYLISGLLLNELTQTGSINLGEFYARRLKRLLPALMTMLIISFVIAYIVMSPFESSKQLVSAPYASTWISNFYFAFCAVDYFDELSARDIFLHTWSLGVEEQFYLFWPVFLLLVTVLTTRIIKTYYSKNACVLFGLAFAFIASLLLSLFWLYTNNLLAFYMMPARIWQFSLGGIIFCITRTGRFIAYTSGDNKDNKTAFIFLLFGLGLILGSAITLNKNLAYPGYWVLIPSFGTAIVILCGQILTNHPKNPLSHSAMVWLGDRSYSLYLWHWPILILGQILGFYYELYSMVILILLMIIIANFSYQYIELPFWKGKYKSFKRNKVILTSVLIMLGMVLVFQYSINQLKRSAEKTDISTIWRVDFPVIYKMSCDAWYQHARVEPCIFGNRDATKSVVFIGDSVGAQWFSMLPAIFREPDWKIILLTKSSCPMVDEDFYYARIGKVYQVCSDWRNQILDMLDKDRPDIVILGNAVTYDFSESQWIDGSRRIFERISHAARHVLVIPGTPTLSFDGPSCLMRHSDKNLQVKPGACLSKNRFEQVDKVTTYLQQAIASFNNVSLLDLNYLACPDNVCHAISKEGFVVYRDTQHLTDSFVRSKTADIEILLKQKINDPGLLK